MSMTPEEIAALLQREGSGLAPDADEESSGPEEAFRRRVTLLSDVYLTCHRAFYSNTGDIELMAQKLGDGSRDVAWRAPFGEASLLGLFLDILSTPTISHNLKVHCLRIVGNSCADTDANRARVVEGDDLKTIIDQLKDESVLPYTIPVLFNTLVDYEPAQSHASLGGLSKQLIALFESPNLPNYATVVPYICKILALLVTQDGEPARANPKTVPVLLSLATSSSFKDDADDFISLVSVAAAYLANETFQASLVASADLGLFTNALHYAYTHFDDEADEDPDTATSLKHLRTSLLTSLADLTGNDSFITHHSLDSAVPQSLLSWLNDQDPHLQAAGCLALGNLSRSDETSLSLVQTHKAADPLIKILSDSAISDAQQLHSALSFLKNLAIPSQNKSLLGDLLEPTCVPRILTLDTLPQVQFAAVSLIRLLLINCPPNVRRICAPRKPSDTLNELTSVHDIISLFNRSDAEPTKLEAARSIAALCRVLHSTPVLPVLPEWDPAQAYVSEAKEETPDELVEEKPSDAKSSKLREFFYKKHDLAKPLAFLVTQQKWLILRSEAWFVFALMSRSHDGADVILSTFEIREVVDALTSAITGQTTTENNDEQKAIEDVTSAPVTDPSAITTSLGLEPQQVDPKQKADMSRVDRENCLVLCTEVLKNCESTLPPAQLELLQDLIRKGTNLIATEKQK